MDILHMTEQAFERGQWMELLIGKDPSHIPVSEFAGYLDYYNNRRIKLKLKGLTPALHRLQALSIA